jgi:hypothetical protein
MDYVSPVFTENEHLNSCALHIRRVWGMKNVTNTKRMERDSRNVISDHARRSKVAAGEG